MITQDSNQLDLRRQSDVESFFMAEKPDYVFIAAAKVGGIYANSIFPASFFYDNLIMEINLIKAAFDSGVKKLLFLGSSCIYPRLAQQPLKEEALLTGELEKTNEAYALAKIAGIKMCEYFNKQYNTDSICVMPSNLYGPGDNYHPQHSHVLPGLIRRFYEAKANGSKDVVIWGTGSPRREFLFVDDLADACVFLMETYSGNEIINIGTGKDISIEELAHLVKEIVCFDGNLIFDPSKPDGTPRKLLDISKLSSLGWTYKTELSDGIRITLDAFQSGFRSD